MKALLNRNALIQVFFLVLFFAASVYIRKANINKPMSREWITAHVLVTLQIWEKGGGPQNYHFSPVFSYPGVGSAAVFPEAVHDDKGDTYYVSYPPLSFITAYYAIKLAGMPISVSSIQFYGLALHFATALLLFLLVLKIQRPGSWFSVAAWVCYLLYLFSPGYLWFHCNLYFADMLMQFFFLAQLLVYGRIYAKGAAVSAGWLALCGVVTVLAIYTEWLGVLTAFCFFCYGTYCWLIKKEKSYFAVLVIIAVATALSLAATFLQYSSIHGTADYLSALLNKYKIRSGLSGKNGSEGGLSISNMAAYIKLKNRYVEHFGGILVLTGITTVGSIALFIKRKRSSALPVELFVICLAAISVLMHYVLMFNFNAVHEFGIMKGGVVLLLLLGLLIGYISNVFYQQSKIYFHGFAAALLLVTLVTIYRGITKQYWRTKSTAYINDVRLKFAGTINKYAGPNEALYTNGYWTPEITYYAGRNIILTEDIKAAAENMRSYNLNEGIFFAAQGDTIVSIWRFNQAGDSVLVK